MGVLVCAGVACCAARADTLLCLLIHLQLQKKGCRATESLFIFAHSQDTSWSNSSPAQEPTGLGFFLIFLFFYHKLHLFSRVVSRASLACSAPGLGGSVKDSEHIICLEVGALTPEAAWSALFSVSTWSTRVGMKVLNGSCWCCSGFLQLSFLFQIVFYLWENAWLHLGSQAVFILQN